MNKTSNTAALESLERLSVFIRTEIEQIDKLQTCDKCFDQIRKARSLATELSTVISNAHGWELYREEKE